MPLPGESLVSLVRRTAAAMGYAGPHRLRPLLADVGKLPANVNPLSAGPLLDLLAVLLRQPSEKLLSMSTRVATTCTTAITSSLSKPSSRLTSSAMNGSRPRKS